MESSGIAGRIRMAASTRELLTDPDVQFERRLVDVKGIGSIETFVHRAP
jgi:hypothetical protein